MGKLTDKQERFCQEYIIDLNATQAAIRAGYSKKTARIKGCQLLTKVNIQNKIQKLKAERSDRVQIEADSVVKELAIVAFSNIRDYLTVDEDGDVFLKGFDKIDAEKLAAIESIKTNTTSNKGGNREYTTTQFKLHSKLNALEQLGRHLGIYEKDNEQSRTIPTTEPLTLEEMKKRIREAEKAGTGIDYRSIEGGREVKKSIAEVENVGTGLDVRSIEGAEIL
ncbi:MAG TPA: terminase small subunit [Sedimentisphaerales bacterium]|nr:terminase small subunit [Sedimentisphaerales bacterium]